MPFTKPAAELPNHLSFLGIGLCVVNAEPSDADSHCPKQCQAFLFRELTRWSEFSLA
jgi:hypothetical protein